MIMYYFFFKKIHSLHIPFFTPSFSRTLYHQQSILFSEKKKNKQKNWLPQQYELIKAYVVYKFIIGFIKVDIFTRNSVNFQKKNINFCLFICWFVVGWRRLAARNACFLCIVLCNRKSCKFNRIHI